MKNKKTVISMVSALCAFALVGGVSAINASANTVLDGFSCAGVSVNAEEVGVRFEFNLTGDATAKKDLDAGVVYMPYDLYTGDLANFTKDTAAAKTAEFGWEDNAETEADGDYVGYTYLAAESIPATMYNRVLLVRGYIVDGETVYYTSPVKASMADSAWKGIAALPDYEETLKAYMGPYTLTSEAGNVENLYYGDNVAAKLPKANAGKNIAAWYWDEAKTDDVAADDYATGSMAIYPKYESFVVSGAVSGADNLESVKVQINGADTDIAVAANGEYSVSLEAGTYDFRFYNDNFVAYVNDVAVSAATEVNATLVDNTWDVGDYKNMKTQGTTACPVQYTADDALTDKKITVTGRDYNVVFPNTATSNAFTYTAKFGATTQRSQTALMLLITDGTNRLAVGCYQWAGEVLASIGSSAGFSHNRLVGGGGVQSAGTMKFVRTVDKIEFYVNDSLVFTFTKGAVESTRAQQYEESLTSGLGYLNSFFEEGTKLAVGVASLRNWTVDNEGLANTIVANYSELSMNEFAMVSGKVSLPEGSTLDLTATTLTVGGTAYDMTIDAEGNFTAYIPEGTQTLVFANGTWGATAADQVIALGETNTVNVTLADYTWVPGTFGAKQTTMNYDAVDVLDGNFAVTCNAFSGLLFPNLATTGSFTYQATFSNVQRSDDDGAYGILMTDGNWLIQIALKRWEPVQTCFSSGNYGYAVNDQWNPAGSGYTGGTLKLVRTAEKIEFYYGDALWFTFTSTEFIVNGFGQLWDNSLDCASQWASIGASFFSTTKPITVGLVALGNCTGFNVSCSFTNN